ncbi:MAG: glycine cleavage system protein GcvH [Candidatus Nanopelagicales bacterium]
MAVNPPELQYTAEHEWIRPAEDGVIRFGITDFAQDALGDIVFVNLPEVGSQVTAGQPCGEVESTKSVSDVFAPVSGTVTARNEALDDEPGAVNTDPYGSGWLVEVKVEGDAVELLTVEAYDSHIAAL